MQLSHKPNTLRLNADDYLTRPFEKIVELIRGKVFHFNLAPSIKHQRVPSYLHRDISQYFKGKTCLLFHALLYVRPTRNDVFED
jgi:hypothetical protein